MVISFLSLINLGGLIILGLWFFNTSGYQQEAGQGYIERISILEEQMFDLKGINKDTVDSLDEDIKFLDKEIRKLWDISNKKNKKNIDNLTRQVDELEKNSKLLDKLNNSLAAKQRAVDLEIAKMEKVQAILKERIEYIDLLEENSDVQERINSQAEAIDAFDAYRKQINKTLLDLQSRLNKLQIKLEDSSI